MSRSSHVDLVMLSANFILEAAQEFFATRRELREIETVRGRQAVDFALETKEGQLIGVRQEQNGELTMVPAKDASPQTVKQVANIKQRYSQLRVLDEVKRRGFNCVKEERLPNGSIRLVVQKWQ